MWQGRVASDQCPDSAFVQLVYHTLTALAAAGPGSTAPAVGTPSDDARLAAAHAPRAAGLVVTQA